MEKYLIRTVQVWLDDNYLEVELEQPKDCNEERFYEMVTDYVFSNISIDIL